MSARAKHSRAFPQGGEGGYNMAGIGERKEMVMWRACFMLVMGGCLTGACWAQGQRPIQWISNANQGVAQAKRAGLPVMFYVSGSSRGENSDLEKAQQRTFRDPLVYGIASERFVPVRLPPSSETRKLLAELKAPPGLRWAVVCATPDGQLIGTIPPGQLTEASVFARQITAVFRKYRSGLLTRDLKPILEDEEARVADITKALKVIKKYVILEADESVVKLLEREGLSKTVRKRVYDILAFLSTRASVKALLELAPQDKQAAQALSKCTPGAAEQMLLGLDLEQPEQLVIVYEAVTKICKISGAKPRGFWSGKREGLLSAEIERVKKEVTSAAQHWRERYEPYR